METSINLNDTEKKFSLEEILREDSDFCNAVYKRVWKRVSGSPSWHQVVVLGQKVEGLDSRLVKIENLLQELLIQKNGGDSQ